MQSVAGQTIVAPGTATAAGSGLGVYTVAVTAAQTANLGQWTATWSDSGNGSAHLDHESVAASFSPWPTLESDQTLQNTDKYPNPVVQAMRQPVEEECEFICDAAFVPRYRRLLDGTAEPDFLQDARLRAIRSAMIITADTTGGAYLNLPAVTGIVDVDVVHRHVRREYAPGPWRQPDPLRVHPLRLYRQLGGGVDPGLQSVTVFSSLNPGSLVTAGSAVGSTGRPSSSPPSSSRPSSSTTTTRSSGMTAGFGTKAGAMSVSSTSTGGTLRLASWWRPP